MKSAQHMMSGPAASQSARASSVLMGRQDFMSVLLRLIGMEVYKLRRRMMSKVLSSINIVATLSLFGLIASVALLMTRNGTSALVIMNFSAGLRLPESLSVVGQLILTLGEILIIILVSTIVGGEYTDKTVRLMLTRGPTRTQVLLSKVGAALACIGLGVVGTMLLGILAGGLLNFMTGIAPSFAFFSLAWIGHTLLYMLITMLGLFVYAMMALFLSTLGRATAAGIAGVLCWSFLIEPVIRFIGLIGRSISGTTGSFLQALPDYLIGTNISALLQDQSQYLFPSAAGAQSPAPSNIFALLVLTAYLAIFIGFALWVSIRRDVTS